MTALNKAQLKTADDPNLSKAEARQIMAEEKSGKKSRGRSDAEKAKDYRRYEDRKRAAREAMKKTTDHLVLVLASDGERPDQKKKFYVLGDNSAFIYAYDLAPRMGRKKVNLRPDLDPTETHFSKVTMIVDLDKFTKEMEKIGAKRIPSKAGDLIVYFKLPHEYTEEMIRNLRKMYEDEIKELNDICFTDKVYPSVHTLIHNIRDMMYHKLMRIDRTHRELFWQRMMDPVFMLSDTNTLAQHGDISAEEAGTEMLRAIYLLYDRISMAQELDLFEISTCAKIGQATAKLKNIVMGEIVNSKKENNK